MEYDRYYLFNGSEVLFSNPSLREPSVVAKINGTFYILQRKQTIVPYKNIAITVMHRTCKNRVEKV
ncbi:hypothetical protein [Pyrococcus sp. NA2]|uniref:hypothetical protein n=1 Tax=Pyrococcus sp. (strain NA2) TaxID=342949 RepID=UPI001872E850|nr:hypothetical protein [Pyrococcus sp. NA2]